MKSVNPYNLEVLEEFEEDTSEIIISKIEKAQEVYKKNRLKGVEARTDQLLKTAEILRDKKQIYAKTMSLEMGKPIKEAYAEVEKCAWVCEYYAENASSFLKDTSFDTDGDKSFVTTQPLGIILAVMPWNFPFWQVFRFAAPALAAGNTALLKHASNVQGCARHLQEIFEEAGFEKGTFTNLYIGSNKVEEVLRHPYLKAATVTGSEKAGKSVASLCGDEIKKTVLELGGSNAFIVLKDADLQAAAKLAVKARMINNAQSCIAAKRFIVDESIKEAFTEFFISEIKKLKSGDPLDEDTQVGPLARIDLAEELQNQLQKSIAKGARLLYGGKRDNAYFEPTVIDNVTKGMPAYEDELFGPVAPIITFKTPEQAIEIANDTRFGLGASIISKNVEKALRLGAEIEDGAVFINELVKSDPRLPFGGTKKSGYGRELSAMGINEFVNHKTVFVNNTIKS